MKSILKYMSVWLMLLLFSGPAIGASVFKMECLMSGNMNYSLGDWENCCHQEHTEQPTFKKVCCVYSAYDISLDERNIEPSVIDFNVALIVKPSLINVELHETNVLTKTPEAFYGLSPPWGKERCIALQTFRI